MLSQKQLSDVCMLHGGAQECRYLDGEPDANGNYQYRCKKKSSERKAVDEEVTEFLQECSAKGQNPHIMGFPLGDNCTGYLPFSSLPQGYDVP